MPLISPIYHTSNRSCITSCISEDFSPRKADDRSDMLKFSWNRHKFNHCSIIWVGNKVEKQAFITFCIEGIQTVVLTNIFLVFLILLSLQANLNSFSLSLAPSCLLWLRCFLFLSVSSFLPSYTNQMSSSISVCFSLSLCFVSVKMYLEHQLNSKYETVCEVCNPHAELCMFVCVCVHFCVSVN